MGFTIGCSKALDSLKDDPEVILQNESRNTIGNFFNRKCGTTSWQRIGGNIRPESEQSFQLKEGCYDFLAEMTTGQELTWENQILEKNNVLTLTVFTDF